MLDKPFVDFWLQTKKKKKIHEIHKKKKYLL